ncbi:MAG: 3-hydroxyacyl-ACP dehydratase FabZ family protein [Planctomycetia bacterium]|nr:3-hydroxyacyl-ACP dehydratase FabZ family protein [Planctomycetia bacterium]
MKFFLVDHILEIEPGRKIVAAKNLSLAEEYLADHFPSYPVLPGVLMLEALVQSAAWLVRASTDFEKTVILLSEARNVRYGTFVRPGQQMKIELEARKIDADQSSFKGTGRVGDDVTIQARIQLVHFNLADRDPRLEKLDTAVRRWYKRRFKIIGGTDATAANVTQ